MTEIIPSPKSTNLLSSSLLAAIPVSFPPLQHYDLQTVHPMKTLLSLCFAFLFGTLSLSAQQQVSGEILSTDSATHTVIRIYADTFPRVNVLFRAQAPDGGAIWSINKNNVLVKENGVDCKVVSVNRISNGQRVNTALVIDHSGSMVEDERYKHWTDSILRTPGVWKTMTQREYTFGRKDSDSLVRVCVMPPCPDYIRPALWHAKRAAQAYIGELDTTKDAVSVIGFAATVIEKISLTTDYERGSKAVEGMRADGGTAFYDAVYTALDETDKGVGIKAVVALTDGQDNSSKHTLEEVIEHARKLGIPVYCIGLGSANVNILKSISKETGGSAFFTQDPMQLTNIYQMISGEIMSIYEMTYVSPNILSANEERSIDFAFEIPQHFNSMHDVVRTVPEEVVDHIAMREEEKTTQEDIPVTSAVKVAAPTEEEDSNWPIAVLVTVAVVSAGVITARATKKPQKEKTGNPFTIVSVYPNPTVGPLTVVVSNDVSGMPGRVIVHDLSGKEVYTVPFVMGSAIDMNVSGLEKGVYLVSVQAGGNVTGGERVVVQ